MSEVIFCNQCCYVKYNNSYYCLYYRDGITKNSSLQDCTSYIDSNNPTAMMNGAQVYESIKNSENDIVECMLTDENLEEPPVDGGGNNPDDPDAVGNDAQVPDANNGNDAAAPAGGTATNSVDYNNWLVNNGLSGISKITQDSSLEDVLDKYNKIAQNLSSTMANIDSALANKDTDAIDYYMNELSYSMNALQAISVNKGLGSLTSSATGWNIGGAAAAGGALFCMSAGYTVAIAAAAPGGLAVATGAAATLSTIPVAGWIAAGVILIGAGIYCGIKVSEENKWQELKKQMQQTMDDCDAKWQYAQQEIGEITEDLTNDAEREINKITQNTDFSDINAITDVANKIDTICAYQQSLETWSELCGKYGIDFVGKEMLDKLGTGNDKNQFANEYIEKFAQHTKDTIEKSGDVVEDTGSYVASVQDIEELINWLENSGDSVGFNVQPLRELIEFIGKTNNDDIVNDGEGIVNDYGSGYYTGGASYGTPVDLSQASQGLQLASGTQSGVTDAASGNKGYDVSTDPYDDAQDDIQQSAQEAVDEYLASFETEGKTIEELEAMYAEVQSTKENNKRYKTGVDLAGFDETKTRIREAQQTIVDDYLAGITVDGKPIDELAALYTEVQRQGEAWKNASQGIDLSGFGEVLDSISEARQMIVDTYAQDASGRIAGATTVSEATMTGQEAAETGQMFQGYGANVDSMANLPAEALQKAQSIVDNEAAACAVLASTVQTSAEADAVAARILNVMSQITDPGVNISALSALYTTVTFRASALREEERQKAEEDGEDGSETAGTGTLSSDSVQFTPGPDAENSTPSGETDTDSETPTEPAEPGETGEVPTEPNETPTAPADEAGTTPDETTSPAEGDEPVDNTVIPPSDGADTGNNATVPNNEPGETDNVTPPNNAPAEPGETGEVPAENTETGEVPSVSDNSEAPAQTPADEPVETPEVQEPAPAPEPEPEPEPAPAPEETPQTPDSADNAIGDTTAEDTIAEAPVEASREDIPDETDPDYIEIEVEE